jgi:aminoglycoside phosphotransferase (APT) family kinase protein
VVGRQVFREVFPDLPPDAPLRRWRRRGAGWHRIEVLEATREPGRRLVLKALPGPDGDSPQAAERRARMMAIEHRVLAEVAPRISEQNPATRCPRVLAYRPASGLLALEAVTGPTLRSVLFGLAPTHERCRVRRLLELCGEWLARFHELTRTGEEGNPFEWALEQFTLPAVRAVFDRNADGPIWVGLCEVARGLRDAYPTFRVVRCAIHGVFAPYHVLVSDGRIYVIDLESSRAGYPYEDLALFGAYYDLRLPWETALAATRLPIDEHRRALLRGYAQHAPAFREPDGLVLRLARLHALIRFPLEWERQGQLVSPKSWLRWRWWRRRFRAVYADELPGLWQAVRRGASS